MIIKKLLAAIAFTLCSITANAQQWVEIAKTDETVFYIQANSFTATENDGGTRVIAAIGKTFGINSNRVDVLIWYVPVSDCIAGRGKFYVLDSNGKPRSNHDFVFQNGTVSSTIAEIICRVGAGNKSNRSNSSNTSIRI